MKINHDYMVVMRGAKWLSYWDKKWMKQRIREEAESGMIAGICYSGLIVLFIVGIFMGVTNG